MALLAGCGSGDYDKKLQASIREVEDRARFGKALDYQPLKWIDLPIQVRMPWAFTRPGARTQYLVVRDVPGNADRLKPEADLQPSLVNLPGILICYQTLLPPMATSRDGYAIHLAAANVGNAADETSLDKIRDDIRAAGAKGPDDKPVEWKDVEVATIDGQKNSMKHLRAIGPGQFRYDGFSGDANLYKGPVVFDLYTAKLGEYRVFIAWLVPTPDELPNKLKDVGLDERAVLMAGTLQLIKN